MKKLLIDAAIIAASVFLAIYLTSIGVVDTLLDAFDHNLLLLSLITGFFFTSFFTTPPAIAVFAGLSDMGNPFLIALVGGLGAVMGDFILFSFVRGRLMEDAHELLKGPNWKRFLKFLRRRRFMRMLPILGALIIASPFPDEIGLALMGISKIKMRTFFLLSYCMNVLGILAILLIAESL